MLFFFTPGRGVLMGGPLLRERQGLPDALGKHVKDRPSLCSGGRTQESPEDGDSIRSARVACRKMAVEDQLDAKATLASILTISGGAWRFPLMANQ